MKDVSKEETIFTCCAKSFDFFTRISPGSGPATAQIP